MYGKGGGGAVADLLMYANTPSSGIQSKLPPVLCRDCNEAFIQQRPSGTLTLGSKAGWSLGAVVELQISACQGMLGFVVFTQHMTSL